MNTHCPRLFTPLRVGGMTLKNRVVMTALQTNFTPGGQANDRFCAFYWARAEGGAGLIIVGGARFDPYGAAGDGFMSLEHDGFVPGWRAFTDGVHARGGKVAVQLYHAGRYAHKARLPAGLEAIAPSALPCSYTHETAREMTLEDIRTVTARWAEGADRAKRCGFDAVEILGSAGYLISQFLSPAANHRTDQYGGSWENRTRFPLEVLSAVRRAVGPDYPILFRIAGNDFVPGSNTNQEAVAFAKLLAGHGADLISVTGGWHETRVPQLPGEVPPGGFTYLAQAVRQAVSVPVLSSNRIVDPALAEETLALGRADCIGMARTLLADPEWPNKVRQGRSDELRRCVACNQGCLASTFFGKPVRCLVNGLAGRESQLRLDPAPAPRRVLVVGGGPAGCECALRAAQRGHRVTLWEGSARLGGQLPLAAAPPGKGEFLTLRDYYEAMLPRSGVAVFTGRFATPEAVLEGDFAHVVIAAGSAPRLLPLPDEQGLPPVLTAAQVLSGQDIPGKDVVIVGGGAVGCETAQFLARRGSLTPEQLQFLSVWRAETPQRIQALLDRSDRTVTVVELAPKLGSGFDPGCAWPVMLDLRRLGVCTCPSSKISAATANSVTISPVDGDGPSRTVPCDTVVLAVGSRPERALYDSLSSLGARVHLLGDALAPGRVLDAVSQAVDLAAAL